MPYCSLQEFDDVNLAIGYVPFPPIFGCTNEELNNMHQATHTAEDPTGNIAQETWLPVRCVSNHMTIISDDCKFT